ncbi:MAG: phosphotransferase [Bacteroidota bacterium]
MTLLHQEILTLTSAQSIIDSESVQTLWSGYGEIVRYRLAGGKVPSIIVKHIQLPDVQDHPRGWNTTRSHERKLRSYQVETCWYQHFAYLTNEACRVPQVLKVINESPELLLILEDLNSSGYDRRLQPDSVSLEDAMNGLTWLANFHARFLTVPSEEGLWPIGTYWHLDTRPEEYDRMENLPLKKVAKAIDQRLNEATFQTIVHGDAKLANFCFSKHGKVAAVDFQYVGRGCGMKDVAYFISSCFDEPESERHEQSLLNHYFNQLEVTVDKQTDFQLLKREWRDLYKYAWADFYRFLDGWSPGHWKMHRYSEKLTRQVMEELTT